MLIFYSNVNIMGNIYYCGLSIQGWKMGYMLYVNKVICNAQQNDLILLFYALPTFTLIGYPRWHAEMQIIKKVASQQESYKCLGFINCLSM